MLRQVLLGTKYSFCFEGVDRTLFTATWFWTDQRDANSKQLASVMCFQFIGTTKIILHYFEKHEAIKFKLLCITQTDDLYVW